MSVQVIWSCESSNFSQGFPSATKCGVRSRHIHRRTLEHFSHSNLSRCYCCGPGPLRKTGILRKTGCFSIPSQYRLTSNTNSGFSLPRDLTFSVQTARFVVQGWSRQNLHLWLPANSQCWPLMHLTVKGGPMGSLLLWAVPGLVLWAKTWSHRWVPVSTDPRFLKPHKSGLVTIWRQVKSRGEAEDCAERAEVDDQTGEEPIQEEKGGSAAAEHQ